MKKIICFMLVLSSIIFGICASAFSDVDAESKEMIEYLTAYSIINGYEDGTFKPDNTITRAEFATIIVKAAMYDFIIPDENVFLDVEESHWAKTYISISQKLGIVNGTTETTFEPEANITNEQAVKMIVAALGYGEEANQKGGYPGGYMAVAQELGLTNGLALDGEAFATRRDVAKMIYNALFCKFYFLYEGENGIERSEAEQTLDELHAFAQEAEDLETDAPETGENSDADVG